MLGISLVSFGRWFDHETLPSLIGIYSAALPLQDERAQSIHDETRFMSNALADLRSKSETRGPRFDRWDQDLLGFWSQQRF